MRATRLGRRFPEKSAHRGIGNPVFGLVQRIWSETDAGEYGRGIRSELANQSRHGGESPDALAPALAGSRDRVSRFFAMLRLRHLDTPLFRAKP